MEEASNLAHRLVTSLVGLLLGAAACTSPPDESVAGSSGAPNEQLLAAIRDGGYLCDTLIEATAVPGVTSSWRVLCNDLLVYVASRDSVGTLHVEPVPNGDLNSVQIPGEKSDPPPDADRPEP